ncbi:hypothetical protein GQ43DRAFT_473464 [Delitschia confertaspora ATCC 74209]|uniref:Histone-lysine N-methyltransferase, H3 lysine-79 specific n=1 Tax=Delitschia confertaspora ATCC 74209 TaxID=1513339 RepID=A0A9P4MU07_9PLEO|nr:hypothetical protein GQ43DRAFT_473464 [Delitschia confertaspora ATCC 74209]
MAPPAKTVVRGIARRQAASTRAPAPAPAPTTRPQGVCKRRVETEKTTTRKTPKNKAQRVEWILNYARHLAVNPIMAEVSAGGGLGRSETYGEMLPAFVSECLKEFRVTKNSRVVDIGSGIGNIVLHSYLERGCHAFGAELEAVRHRAATSYRAEIVDVLAHPPTAAHVRGLPPGSGFAEPPAGRVSLIREDCFAAGSATEAEVKKAKLVFCSNLTWPVELVIRQEDAVLLRLRKGAVFVILRQVVTGRRGRREKFLQEHGLVEERRMSARDRASWTSAPVEFYVYKKVA